jgi:transposase
LDLGRIYGMAKMRKHPVELRERAVAMVRELERELGGSGRGAIARVAKHLGLNAETVRHWVRQDEAGRRPSGERVAGSEADRDARIAELERENRELRRANDILKAASAFFAQEMNPRPPL